MQIPAMVALQRWKHMRKYTFQLFSGSAQAPRTQTRAFVISVQHTQKHISPVPVPHGQKCRLACGRKLPAVLSAPPEKIQYTAIDPRLGIHHTNKGPGVTNSMGAGSSTATLRLPSPAKAPHRHGPS